MGRVSEVHDREEVFGTVCLEHGASILTASDGDLWPTCWADDGYLYSANGDGAGFSDDPAEDIVVNRLSGDPSTGITGTRLSGGRDVTRIWGDTAQFNAKPTGMVAVDGNGDGKDELYLAVQDLRMGTRGFDEAPVASVVTSEDYGLTWRAAGQPMFTDHVFTTIMFLDFGRSNKHPRLDGESDAAYVYAYGIDGNWRTSFTALVPDPEALYLARVRTDQIMQRDSWEFLTGLSAAGFPSWAADIDLRVPVLSDTRRLYPDLETYGRTGQSVIAQGGVTYNAALRRYFYTSWSEFTFQFFTAEQPWGPWVLFHQQDFGPYPWTGPLAEQPKHGGYATSIPSKFISADGTQMWVQSNWFWTASAYTGNTYSYALRALRVQPLSGNVCRNARGPENLAEESTGAEIVANCCRSGAPEVLRDGVALRSEDSWNGRTGQANYWGYTWPAPLRLDTLVLTSGPRDYNGGWFADTPNLEVRIARTWQVLDGVAVTPYYPADSSSTGFRSYTFAFAPVVADGIRVLGLPGGLGTYTAVSELAVYYLDGVPVPARTDCLTES